MTDADTTETDTYDPANDPFACSICGEPIGELKRVRGEEYCDCCHAEYVDSGPSQGPYRKPRYIAEGGEGLPPVKGHPDVVYLFTCCSCGKRLANPHGPPSGNCRCGGEYVCHTFDPAEYNRIRWYNDSREAEIKGESEVIQRVE